MGGSEMALASMGLMGYTAAAQYGMQKSAGQIQRMESEAMAEQEELGATQREADRKARLAEAMASQVAGAGAAGISAFEGSPLTILQADLEKEQEATQRGKFMTQLKAEAFRSRGRVAEKLAKQTALLGLLGTAGKMGMMAKSGLDGGVVRGGGRGGGTPGAAGVGGSATFNPYTSRARYT